MRHTRTTGCTWIALIVTAVMGTIIASSSAQHTFEFTKTVDPSGNADFTSIQAAINAVPDNPSDKWTILVYAGTYQEAITLDDTKENVDIVGVDRDAVIIFVDDEDDVDAITIEGWGARNNTIRNLTIITNDASANQGRGIVIKKPDSGSGDKPSAVRIDGVYIKTSGWSSAGIEIIQADRDIVIIRTTIETSGDNSAGIFVPSYASPTALSDLRIIDSRIVIHGGSSNDLNADAVKAGIDVDSMLIKNVVFELEGAWGAVYLATGGQDIDLDTVTVRDTNEGRILYIQDTTPLTPIRLRLTNCDFLDNDGSSVYLIDCDDVSITNCSLVVDNAWGPDVGYDDTKAIYAINTTNLRITDCRLRGREWGVFLDNDCTNVTITNSSLIGSHYGLEIESGDDIVVTNCQISGDSARGELNSSPPDYYGVYITDDGSDPIGSIRFSSCDISAVSSDKDFDAIGIKVDPTIAMTGGPVVFANCTTSAHQSAATGTDVSNAWGVISSDNDAVALIGGSVTSSDGDEKETDQFDLKNSAATPSATPRAIRVAGTRFSKWSGPIASAERPRSIVQRTLDVSIADVVAVHAAIPLTGSEQEITASITDPDVYRVLSATSTGGATGTIYVVGKDWGGNQITDSMTISGGGSLTENGEKPFAEVTMIILPAGSGSISIGISELLGLEFPISGASAVLQQAREKTVGGNTFFAIEAVSTPDIIYSTIDLTSDITADDSFEWVALASQ